MLHKSRLQSALRSFRMERDLTQADLGRLLGLSRQTVTNWETGRFIPSDAALEALQAVGFDSSPFLAPPISGATIRRWRLRHRLTQPIVADALGVGTSSVSHWELNNKTPKPHIRQHLFRLGCPDDDGNRYENHADLTAHSGPCSTCPHYHPCKKLVDHDLWTLGDQTPPTPAELLRAADLLERGAFADDPNLTNHIIETLALNSLEETMAQIPDPPRAEIRGPMERIPLWS